MVHPARTSSLRGPPSPKVFPKANRNSDPILAVNPNLGSNAAKKEGLEDLAASRAELYLLSRSVLELVGYQRNWFVGWEPLSDKRTGTEALMAEVNLSDDRTHPASHEA